MAAAGGMSPCASVVRARLRVTFLMVLMNARYTGGVDKLGQDCQDAGVCGFISKS